MSWSACSGGGTGHGDDAAVPPDEGVVEADAASDAMAASDASMTDVGPASDAQTVPDTGTAPDVGASSDAGTGTDAAANPDTGAGSGMDAAMNSDAGGTADTGAPIDVGVTADAGSVSDVPSRWVKRWPPVGASTCGDPDIWVTAMAVRNGSVWVGTRCSEVFRTDDQGQTWVPLPTPITRLNAVRPVEDLVFVGNRLFVLLRVGKYNSTTLADEGPLFASDDGGQTWLPFMNGLPSRNGTQLLSMYDLHYAGGRLFVTTFGLGVHASDPNVAGFTPFATRSSLPADQGVVDDCPNVAPYVDTVTGLPFGFLHALELEDDGTTLYMSNKCGGVYRTSLSAGTAAWAAFATGLPLFGGYYQEPFSLRHDRGYLYAGIDDEGAYRSPVGGAPDFQFVTATGNFVSGFNKFDPLVFRRVGEALYMGTSFSGLYTSLTGVSPWSWTGALQPDGTGIGTGADTISVVESDPGFVYVGSMTGFYVGAR